MTLADARNKTPPKSLSKLSPDEYSLLWHCGFWDGPTDGMLLYRGEEFWFEMIQENETVEEGQWYRRYAVVRLTPEQLEREHEVHEAFRRYVGTHCDYTAAQQGEQGLRPKEQWHHFYDEHLDYCRSQRFEECEVTGWFER
jgi:hypothetical protein